MTSSMDTPEPQAICNPITSSAIFIVATLLPGSDAASQVCGWCGDIAALTRSVGKRVPNGNLSCVCGFSANAWDALFGSPRPASLHPFREFGVEGRRAVATPGDILLHIRADQMDLCFELATQLCSALNGAITVVDPSQLEPTLRDLLTDDPKKLVILQGDQSVILGEAVRVMDLAKRAGAQAISIAARKESAPSQ